MISILTMFFFLTSVKVISNHKTSVWSKSDLQCIFHWFHVRMSTIMTDYNHEEGWLELHQESWPWEPPPFHQRKAKSSPCLVLSMVAQDILTPSALTVSSEATFRRAGQIIEDNKPVSFDKNLEMIVVCISWLMENSDAGGNVLKLRQRRRTTPSRPISW